MQIFTDIEAWIGNQLEHTDRDLRKVWDLCPSSCIAANVSWFIFVSIVSQTTQWSGFSVFLPWCPGFTNIKGLYAESGHEWRNVPRCPSFQTQYEWHFNQSTGLFVYISAGRQVDDVRSENAKLLLFEMSEKISFCKNAFYSMIYKCLELLYW